MSSFFDLNNKVAIITGSSRGIGKGIALRFSELGAKIIVSSRKIDACEQVVKEILPQVKSLSSKQQLITMVGYREGAGHKLVSEAAAQNFEAEWRAEVRSASPEDLERETDLLRTLLLAKREAGPNEPEPALPNSPRFTYAILASARSEVKSQSMDSRFVHRKPRLAWKILIEVYGGEDRLREQIDALKASPPDDVDDLLELADKYISGWRPSEFDNE